MSQLDKLDELMRRVAAILVGATLLLGGSSMAIESAGAERRWGVLAVAAGVAFL